ncbi:MAG: nicotinate-nucleotide--dimethylbenzimidazole phosphoribosyltransferase [Cellulosilyticaceae bacterium]
MMEALMNYVNSIQKPDREIAKETERRIDGLTKPVGALGKMEELVIRLSSIQGKEVLDLSKKAIIIMCADNGVYEEGISECPQEVTATVTYNFTRGITGVNRLAEFAKAQLHIVDIGVKADYTHPEIHNRKIAYGTRNMTKEPAMSYEETLEAIWVGIQETEVLIDSGVQVFGTGEMGIGNTTTSAAVIATLLGLSVETVVGKGAGARAETLARKQHAILEAIAVNKPRVEDPIDVLSKIGGLDLAGLVGVYLAAAKHQKPVVIDGFISVAAALIAYRLAPMTRDYMFASHLSYEVGMQHALLEMGLEAHFALDMRLGEGSGCPLMFQLMDMAYFTLSTMGTFEEAGVDKSKYMDIWKVDPESDVELV